MADVTEQIHAGHIRFAPAILKRLGEELNPSIDQGLIELVKNAYDADATICTIDLGEPGPRRRIRIRDDGVGMSLKDITENWLVLGSSSKRTSVKTPLGRVPAGNKGLGRLAALRLGNRVRLRAQQQNAPFAHTVEIDWRAFDRASTVDEVLIEIATVPSDPSSHGTDIELLDVDTQIGRVDVRKLARALVLLADPFGDAPTSFAPELRTSEYTDLARLVRTRYFDDAEYHLKASLRAGIATARIEDWRGNAIWSADHFELRRRFSEPYDAPDIDFDFWAFLLSSQKFTARTTQLGAVREWLQQFGGVHVYVNDIRVAPYGDPGNDWLDINLARVRSPEERPSTNNAIGRLLITDDPGLLLQKTDRSGFIETPGFHAIHDFAVDALEWMARRRIESAERSRQQARTTQKSESQQDRSTVKDRIDQVADPATRQQLNAAFNQYDKARERETEQLRREIQLYRTLSTAGITAATFAHESNGNPLKTISLVTNTLKYSLRRALPTEYDTTYERPLAQIGSAVESLSVLSNATLDLINRDKRRMGKLLLNATVREVTEIFEPFLKGRAVDLELDLSSGGEPYIRGTAASLESVITNLMNNSLAAFERVSLDRRRLRISSRVGEDTWELTVADNGPGIEGISLSDIWLPGETQRPGGTGLGLTIVRDAVSDLGGEVSAVSHGPLGGASFVVRLTINGVDDE